MEVEGFEDNELVKWWVVMLCSSARVFGGFILAPSLVEK